MKNLKIVLATGGFDPVHSGHLSYLYAARELGDKLVVGINSDSWLERKKGRSFMPITERTYIIQAMRMVDHAILFDDSDGSAIEAIRNVQMMYPGAEIIFANGGDRTSENIPEMVCKDVVFKFGVGGTSKANSSSWILEEWKTPKTDRSWGYYRVLHDVIGTKVKELTVSPGQTLSMQRHANRSEFWHVTKGQCHVNTMMSSGYTLPTQILTKFGQIQIDRDEWHQLSNPYAEPCRLVEIQYGTACTEDDIERR